MKKIICMSLVIIMIFTLCSCNNATSNTVEIEFYQQNEADVELFDKIISDFEKENPDIKVTQINLPEEESGSVLNTRIQNGDSPDIYNEWFGEDMFNKVELGVVRDLTDSPLCDYINESALKQNAYKDKYYLFPMTINFMGVYYNVDLFEKHNITIPTTIDEFWEVCKIFDELGITPIAAGDKDGWNLAHWGQDVMGVYMPDYSEEFLKIFDGKMKASEMNGISDFADIIINRSKYVQEGPLGADSDAMISLFVNQEAAMLINGSWWMGTLNSADMDFEYAVFPFPGKTLEDTKIMSNPDYSFMLSSTSSEKEQQAAEKFLEYILSEGAKHYIGQSGSPSALKAINADSSRYTALIPYLETGLTFRMPQSARWTGATYLDYTVAIQNLVESGDKEHFYKEFEQSLLTSGKPETYVK